MARLLDEALEREEGLRPGKERFRNLLLRRFYERYQRRLGSSAFLGFDDLEAALRRGGFLTRFLDAALRLPKPDAVVRRLLTSPAALAEHAEGILERREQRLLLRDRPRRAAELAWSVHDLPLLDEARSLRRRAAAAVRARDRRRGAGSLTAAAPQRGTARGARPDDPRRHRPGHGAGSLPRVERGRDPPTRRGSAGRGAATRVPRPGRDHGSGAAAPGRDRARRGAARRLPDGGGSAEARAGRGGRAARRRAPRGGRGRGRGARRADRRRRRSPRTRRTPTRSTRRRSRCSRREPRRASSSTTSS